MAATRNNYFCYYDDNKFEYRDYWHGRKYENDSEIIALKRFFSKIDKSVKLSKLSLLDIGAGFGRLASFYLPKVKSAVLLEPSKKLSKQARENLKKYNNFNLISDSIEQKSFLKGRFDIVLMIRVVHHLESPKEAFRKINSLLVPGGYLILEYPNKIHFKNLFLCFFGRCSSLLALERIDRRSAEEIKSHSIPFYNYHPFWIGRELKKNCFELIEKRSVSNLRSSLLKKIIPYFFLIQVEKLAQKTLSVLWFGPSVFVLARKTK